jgi:hypothetical protein
MPTLGIEMEMAVIDRTTGRSHPVRSFFGNLHGLKTAHGEQAELQSKDGRDIAVQTAGINSSLDNAFNNLESSIGPTPGGTGNLASLEHRVREELDAVCAALDLEGATILNMAEHPGLPVDQDYYHRVRAPKPIYDYWIGTRGWDHAAGIDAKAQNSPSTGVDCADAVTALNSLLALSPALIALYANSPFEAGRITGFKENRLTLWPRMFGGAVFPGDRRLHSLPERPFRDLRDYFSWMYGPGTVMQCVPQDRQQAYKSLRELYHIDAQPSLLEFLTAPRWEGHCITSGAAGSVVPGMHHVEFLQYASFLDARIRFRFKDTTFEIEEFLAAWNRPGALEALFAAKLDCCYIEGRAVGANFPDRELAGLADSQIAESVVLSPSALQTGLLRNLREASRLADTIPWEALPALRTAAIRHGLDGQVGDLTLKRLCRQVVEVAGCGLGLEEEWMLAYPLHVLRSGLTGADRALRDYGRLNGSPEERCLTVARERAIVWPLTRRRDAAGQAQDSLTSA